MGETSSKIPLNREHSVSENKVSGLVRPVKIGHVWMLNNFRNLCERKKTGESISSPAFICGHVNNLHKWHMVLYPNGDTELNKGYVSIYLQMVNNGVDDKNLAVKTTFSLSLINIVGEEVHKHIHRQNLCFVKDKTLWGYNRFIRLTELLDVDKGYCRSTTKNSRITIFFKNDGSEKTECVPLECNLLNLAVNENFHKVSSDFETLLQNRQLSDVTIVAQEDSSEFHAHKVILGARSPVFAAMFEHDMREKAENVITLKDIRRDILQEVLRFIYSGRINNLESIAHELLPAADRYALEDLKSTCEEVIYNGMNVSNAVELLIYADLYNAKSLKNRINAFVIKNSKDVVETAGFKSAMDTHPHLIAMVFQKMVQMQ